MTHSSDDVHQMMDESSARFHPKRGRKTRGLRQHEYNIKAERLQYNDFHPCLSGEIDKRISSSFYFIRTETPPNNVISRDSSKPNFSSYLQVFFCRNLAGPCNSSNTLPLACPSSAGRVGFQNWARLIASPEVSSAEPNCYSAWTSDKCVSSNACQNSSAWLNRRHISVTLPLSACQSLASPTLAAPLQ
ncbi:unnamed protein product [Protopolystoma xenopodis]|uniref:Uncharacterized protein n=1 Tax=Protopolystoma xenopodis TaxID=117903 RepID=A0A448XPC2_9PLAT|nr:unnamed protein product [Protopolystoma xenopodis]